MPNIEISLTSGEVIEVPNVTSQFIDRIRDDKLLTIDLPTAKYFIDVDEIVYVKVIK